MTILSQNYNNLLKKMIFETFFDNLKEKLSNTNNSNNVFNYIDLTSNLDRNLNNIARQSLIEIFKSLDEAYSKSEERKRKYDIKAHHTRTILTIFGEITFKRTYYQSKINGESYCFLDRYLGLHKYDYFDPYLKALVIEYAANNSMPKTATYINNLIGNRITINSKIEYLSRQTVRNIILKASFSKPHIDCKEETPETLYIMADEKWIHTQNNNKQDVMEKSIVLFEGIKNKKLVKKQVFASLDGSLVEDCLDYLYYTYNSDKIKTIYCMGDGANWIKGLYRYFKFTPNSHVISALDKFHFKQAIHHICQNKDLEKILTNYVLNNELKNFKDLCDALIQSNPYRQNKIEEKKQYILSNWIIIRNLYEHNLSCPMESQISHNIADIFTSRPKGYSKKMIKKLTKIRLLFKNNYNLKLLYLNNFNFKKILTISEKQLNFDLYGPGIAINNPVNLITDYITSEWPFRY